MINYQIKDKLIVALDFSSEKEAVQCIEDLGEEISFYKVGLELFLSSQGNILSYLKEQKKNIFLDLKFYDIPNTMLKASEFVNSLDVNFFTIHCSAGVSAIKTLTQFLYKEQSNTLALGVTVLTSFSEAEFQETYQTSQSILESSIHFAKMSYQNGLKGFICSPFEAKQLKQYINNAITVCPGIRYQQSDKQDQVRVMSPFEAISNGADFIVMGRDIIQSNNRKEMAYTVQQDILKAINQKGKI